MDHITDAELVAMVRGGDKEAFGHLVERYQYMVERIARKMITDEWIAHELAQEAILQAYLSLNHLRDASRFKSWLYGITLNICRSYLHDQQMDVLSLETIMGGMHSDFVISFDDTVDPQTVAEEHDLHRLVLQAIEGLSSKDKEATLLFYYEQLTVQEIAALLISNGNGEHHLDARPSDALALAVLMKRPIYVADTLMERFEQALRGLERA